MKYPAYNPFLPLDTYIPDGEPHVFGDRVYLFGSHDKEGGESYCLLDYEFWSAPVDDLSDWTCPGTSYSPVQDPLYSKERPYVYAPDVVRGNDGRYYLYYCLAGWKGKGGYNGPISVAVCDRPDGHYEYLGFVKNPDGTAFNDVVCFDPAVINDEGTIRLYFGSGAFRNMEVTKGNAFILSRVYAKVYGQPAYKFTAESSPIGAFTIELEDDMQTVRGTVKKLKISGAEGHAFFEGASIRKINKTYYFVYSSQLNHELCYAVSAYPDKDFVYGGTIVSNGDVGLKGRREKDRLNMTGTTHGGIECINGRFYVFYHRLTHAGDYSRQGCAEPIESDAQGAIKQAEITSCGLNGSPLKAEGTYPAAICCNLYKTKGHMPHGSNGRTKKNIPQITDDGVTRFVRLTSNSQAVYKYFDFGKGCKYILNLTLRGLGTLEINICNKTYSIEINSPDTWQRVGVELGNCSGVSTLSLKSGKTKKIEILEFCFEAES